MPPAGIRAPGATSGEQDTHFVLAAGKRAGKQRGREANGTCRGSSEERSLQDPYVYAVCTVGVESSPKGRAPGPMPLGAQPAAQRPEIGSPWSRKAETVSRPAGGQSLNSVCQIACSSLQNPFPDAPRARLVARTIHPCRNQTPTSQGTAGGISFVSYGAFLGDGSLYLVGPRSLSRHKRERSGTQGGLFPQTAAGTPMLGAGTGWCPGPQVSSKHGGLWRGFQTQVVSPPGSTRDRAHRHLVQARLSLSFFSPPTTGLV